MIVNGSAEIQIHLQSYPYGPFYNHTQQRTPMSRRIETKKVTKVEDVSKASF
jgi:hypothetical protein